MAERNNVAVYVAVNMRSRRKKKLVAENWGMMMKRMGKKGNWLGREAEYISRNICQKYKKNDDRKWENKRKLLKREKQHN